jgi:biopolymer transport protein ExbB
MRWLNGHAARRIVLLSVMLSLWILGSGSNLLLAQSRFPSSDSTTRNFSDSERLPTSDERDEFEDRFNEPLESEHGEWENGPPEEEGLAASSLREAEGINLFELLWQSRWWLIPILIMSFIVVTVGVERSLSLRRGRVLPRRLVTEMGKLAHQQHGFDPREAFRICQKYPSAAASVIKVMLLKVGRPHSELEHAVQEASEREAQRLYGNVRWLNLAAGVTPLMGLMGTVWGMIRAFHDTTQMAPGLNKAEYLAEGIYLALVTTLAGLAVAIPATILAHYFEGRVVNLFHQVDELLLNLMPQVERYEGRARFGALAAENPPLVDTSLAAGKSDPSSPRSPTGTTGSAAAPAPAPASTSTSTSTSKVSRRPG